VQFGKQVGEALGKELDDEGSAISDFAAYPL
jgi:hypothetical protein